MAYKRNHTSMDLIDIYLNETNSLSFLCDICN